MKFIKRLQGKRNIGIFGYLFISDDVALVGIMQDQSKLLLFIFIQLKLNNGVINIQRKLYDIIIR